jgi:hypothetical protein
LIIDGFAEREWLKNLPAFAWPRRRNWKLRLHSWLQMFLIRSSRAPSERLCHALHRAFHLIFHLYMKAENAGCFGSYPMVFRCVPELQQRSNRV